MAEASLVAKSAHFDESLVESAKLHLLLVEARSQVKKDLAKAHMALGEEEAKVIEA